MQPTGTSKPHILNSYKTIACGFVENNAENTSVVGYPLTTNNMSEMPLGCRERTACYLLLKDQSLSVYGASLVLIPAQAW